MSDLDDLEDIAKQARYGFNRMTRGVPKAARDRLKRAQQRAAKAQRSVAKQQIRSSERRGLLVRIKNQE